MGGRSSARGPLHNLERPHRLISSLYVMPGQDKNSPKQRTTRQLAGGKVGKRDKRDHRLAALAKTDWTPTAKDEVREVLNLAYTSSDESSYEYDSDSERRFLACYKTNHLPWKRTRLTKVKKYLDAVHE
ncbi:PREDICTED: uncharacterized protein LOC107356693 [Acropora digitifera]|uniref:uncharacterized protein LOC107356693 n=1 Tax=Acropora digitifera TaxID=70779 RepID=UPI00077A076E|nr:PREDICTED: uncharacterized protein LOC107356693 [Acropora digitifera]